MYYPENTLNPDMEPRTEGTGRGGLWAVLIIVVTVALILWAVFSTAGPEDAAGDPVAPPTTVTTEVPAPGTG